MFHDGRVGARLGETLDVRGSNGQDHHVIPDLSDLWRVREAEPPRARSGVDDDAVEDVGFLVSQDMLNHADPLTVRTDDVSALFERQVRGWVSRSHARAR